ncbi:hypothetical protein L3073_18035 [Ancylomarina sp. DW003]|nr:hypothetical protein [Ancylomarina sp. DW003]MDE5424118.1 hypothetical protein [Ancylomarina sp. DW003]
MDIETIEISILIENGKIREYHGLNFTNYFVASMIPNPNIQEGDFDYKTIEMNEDFKLSKVAKYDSKKNGIKANYKVECHELYQSTFKDVYVNLNFIEKFRIDYAKKQTIFHEMKFKQKLVYFLLFSIPALFIAYLLNNSGKLTTKNQATIKTTEIVNTKPKELSAEVIKTSSVIFFIPNSTEFDSIAKLDNSGGIYEVSSDFGYYANKIVELYKDSTINVNISNKRLFKANNELISKYEQESPYGIIFVKKNEFKIETGVFTDIGIQQMIKEYFKE